MQFHAGVTMTTFSASVSVAGIVSLCSVGIGMLHDITLQYGNGVGMGVYIGGVYIGGVYIGG